MTRDRLLFAVAGIFVGFLAGYFLQEVMAARQPQRLSPEQAAAIAAAGGGAAGPAGPAGPSAATGQPTARPGATMEDVSALSERVARNPQDFQAVLGLANMNLEIGNWQRARELYESYLEENPGEPDVLSGLGIAHRELGEPERALELFREAQAAAPAHWVSRYYAAVVQAFDLGDVAAAQETMEELQRLQPNNPDVQALAAELERRSGA